MSSLRTPSNSKLIASIVAGALSMTAMLPASAALIIDNTTTGNYNAGLGTSLDTLGVNDPIPCANVGCGDATLSFGSAPNLGAASVALGAWLTTPSTPGGAWTGTQAIPQSWAVNDETAIIYTFDAQAGLQNVSLALGVDNGIFVWLDGNYVFGARAGGGSSLGEYMPVLGNIGAGIHYLQLLREDHGGGTGYDIRLTADFVRPSVPEPASLWMLGLGVIGLIAARRRNAAASRR